MPAEVPILLMMEGRTPGQRFFVDKSEFLIGRDERSWSSPTDSCHAVMPASGWMVPTISLRTCTQRTVLS